LALIDFVEPPAAPDTLTETTVSPPKLKPALMSGLTSAACDPKGVIAATANINTGKDFRIVIRIISFFPLNTRVGPTRDANRPRQ
jgi:hypothetical protein